jgi:ribokinase
MFDVITIGSGLVDVFVFSPELQLTSSDGKELMCSAFGEKLSVEKLKVVSGGAGTNAAVAFRRLGFSTAAVVELGKDVLSKVVLSELEKEGVSTALVIQEKKEETGGSVILVAADGGRTVLVYRGAASMLGQQDLPLEEMSAARWLHVSSLGDGFELLPKIWGLSRHTQVPMSWCPGSAELAAIREGKLRVSDSTAKLVFMNQHEWDSIPNVQQELKQRTPTIVITNGAEGGTVYDRGNDIKYLAWQEKSVDDTGAGDAFAAAYAAATLANHPTQVAIQWGLANASSVIQHIGAKAGLLSRDKLETMIADHARR